MRELRFLEISDLGDNLEEQERSLSFDARQTWIQIQTSWIMLNYQHGLFFFLESLNFCFLFWKTQDNDNTSLLLLLLLSH